MINIVNTGEIQQQPNRILHGLTPEQQAKVDELVDPDAHDAQKTSVSRSKVEDNQILSALLYDAEFAEFCRQRLKPGLFDNSTYNLIVRCALQSLDECGSANPANIEVLFDQQIAKKDEQGQAYARKDLQQVLATKYGTIEFLKNRVCELAQLSEVRKTMKAFSDSLEKGVPDFAMFGSVGERIARLSIRADGNTTYDLEELINLPGEETQWLADGWICRGKLHVIAGREGGGKSTLVHDLALSVIEEKPWLGWYRPSGRLC